MAADMDLVAAILNAAWMVRHYARGRGTTPMALRRAQAIQKLGLTVRHALNSSDDFEKILAAVVDGLRPKDEPPF
jgi:hypothetical protein